MVKVAGFSLDADVDALFGKCNFKEFAAIPITDDVEPDFSWDADSTATLEFGGNDHAPRGRKPQKHDSCISVASAMPWAFEHMADLASEVGEADNGMVVPNMKGIFINLGFDVLVRMCVPGRSSRCPRNLLSNCAASV